MYGYGISGFAFKIIAQQQKTVKNGSNKKHIFFAFLTLKHHNKTLFDDIFFDKIRLAFLRSFLVTAPDTNGFPKRRLQHNRDYVVNNH